MKPQRSAAFSTADSGCSWYPCFSTTRAGVGFSFPFSTSLPFLLCSHLAFIFLTPFITVSQLPLLYSLSLLDRLTFLTSRLRAVPLLTLLDSQPSWLLGRVAPAVVGKVRFSRFLQECPDLFLKVLKTLASLPQPQGLRERSRRACRVPQS